MKRLAVTGVVAALAAMAATALGAAAARAAGVDFAVSGSDETIPVSGVAVVTGFFSLIGIVIALVLQRWSARPAERFVWSTVSLTAVSLVPPVLAAANTTTAVALIALHLVAAAVMIPALARRMSAAERLAV
ncbi:DUF6069 family protein [Aeromicrobium sp. 9AM]|uniref:DUF6069 family protein n=1 Tax=Aeromicrobium sp. 9AM TaxID=2653126 RepID=UPI0012F016AD|nr:DUF6069 family protein [Aeromicrobium sp. 9AM]VXC27485.1 conserved membrane hypothetical protein [Aeromicrobium sp. 9AM]